MQVERQFFVWVKHPRTIIPASNQAGDSGMRPGLLELKRDRTRPGFFSQGRPALPLAAGLPLFQIRSPLRLRLNCAIAEYCVSASAYCIR